MTKEPAERELVCEGRWCQISYAVRADMSPAPAKDVMSYLSEGTWSDGENVGMHADEQVDSYAKMLATMQYYAEHGEGDRPESMNGLQDGIFEFKAGRARIAFYDTPGGGVHIPKNKYVDRHTSPNPDSITWWIPDLDQRIRLCNGWPKRHRLARPGDIATARKLRREDLDHDRS